MPVEDTFRNLDHLENFFHPGWLHRFNSFEISFSCSAPQKRGTKVSLDTQLFLSLETMQDQMVSKTKGTRMNKNYLAHLHERCDWCLNHWLLFKNLTHELFRTFLTTVLLVHNLNEFAEETNASSNLPQQLSLALFFSCFQRKSFWQTNQRYLVNL